MPGYALPKLKCFINGCRKHELSHYEFNIDRTLTLK